MTGVQIAEMKEGYFLGTDAIIGAYIQIPFCKTLCRFCCWVLNYKKRQLLGVEKYREAYISAIKREILLRSRVKEERDRLDLKVIHFGGGTPSILTTGELEDILSTLYRAYDIRPGSLGTIGIEVRPGSVNRRKLTALRSAGFNRISIGAQTFNENVLRSMGRSVLPGDFFQCYEDARTAGFKNINIDLLFGLPGQTMDIVERDAAIVAALTPEHIETSPWKPVIQENGEFILDGGWEKKEKARAALLHRHIFEENGYINYVHKCFSRQEHENLLHLVVAFYQLPFIAFGAGADQHMLPKTTSDIEAYIAEDFVPEYLSIRARNVVLDKDPLAFVDIVCKRLLLPKGIWLPGFIRQYNCDVVSRIRTGWAPLYWYPYQFGSLYVRSRLQIFRKLQKWLETGVIKVENGWLRLHHDYQIHPETWALYMQCC